MKYQDTEHWVKFDESKSLLFLAELLNEMLFDYTLDTYKPNALNVHSLIHESLEISEKIKEGAIKESNYEHIRDELTMSFKKDITLKKILKDKHFHYLCLIKESKSHEELKVVLDSLHYYLSNKKYFELLKATLKEEVKAGNSKSNIFSIARAFITEILEYGYEKSYIYSVVNSTFFNKKKSVESLNSLDYFFEQFNFKTSKFIVTFICSKEFESIKDSIREFDLKITKKQPKLPNINASKKFLESKFENCIFIIANEVEALDHAAARNIAERKLIFISDLFSFYNHQLKLQIASNAYVCNKNSGYCLNLSRQTDAIKKGQDLTPKDVSETVGTLRKNMALNDRSLYQFTKAVQLHRLAIDANELENQLLDLWAAIETLISIQPNSNKNRIQQIVDFLAPVLSVNYMKKLLTELKKDLDLWNPKMTEKILSEVIEVSNPIEKLGLLIATTNYEQQFKELDEALNEFPLLKNRIGTYSKWCKTDKELQSLLERHCLKVSWQIRRIYRARNSIIHNGEKPHQLEILVENLHSYVDSCIKGISDLVIEKSGESVSQFFIETKVAYNEHISALIKNGKKPINKDNFKKLIFGEIEE